MTEKDITRIKIGQFGVGIIGLQQLMEEMAEVYAEKSDEEVCSTMLDRLGKLNYIPAGAKEDYGRAFVREFRKFKGQPYDEESHGALDIKVLGPGCPECDRLEQTIMETLSEIRMPASVEHVRDMKEIARYRVMGTPALVINGKVVSKGSVPSRDKIKKWLIESCPASAGKEAKKG